MNLINDYGSLFSSDLILIFLGSLILIVFLVYIIYKDSVITKKLKSYEFAIEDINRHIHMLEKKQNSNAKDQKKDANVGVEIKKAMTLELTGFADTIMLSIREIQENQKLIKNDLQNKITRLEEKTKEYMSVPSSPSLDENRVVSLYKAGYSKEDIAKELHANVSEISFILSIANINK